MQLVSISLLNDAFYTTDVDLEGQRFRLQFSWCERTGLYYLDIFTSTGSPIIYGVALVPNNRLIEETDLSTYGLSGMFFLLPIPNADILPNPDTFGELFVLLYAYDNEV